MTYRQLLHSLEELEDEQLDYNVFVFFDEEYFSCSALDIKEKNDRLDDGHPYIVVD